jgi:hypothetical protein
MNFGELESNDTRTMLQYEATDEANSGNRRVFRGEWDALQC